MNDVVRPARPHHKLTADGRRMREVLTYSRRGNRFTPRQAESWAAHHADWVIPEEAVDRPGFALAEWFGREAPLIVEIGPGIGEATSVLAAARPDHDVLALEVWLPGIADSLWRVAEAGADNVRFCSVDAVWTLENLIEPGSLAVALQIDAFRINPGHAPVSPRAAAQTPRIIGDCVGMMLVHVPEDLRFRRLESGSIRGNQ